MINYILIVVFGIVSYILYQKWTRRKLPPGPMPLPFIGNLIEIAMIGGDPHEALHRMAKKYGNLISLTVGVVPTILVSGSDMIRNMMKTEEFDNRLDDDWILDRSYGKKTGLIFSEAEYWRKTRHLTTRILHDFGFGKSRSMEDMILDEFKEFIQTLKTKLKNDDILLVDSLFNCPMTNIVWSSITGKRFEYDDPEFHKLNKATDAFMRAGQVGGCNLLGAFPFLVRYLPEQTGFNSLHEKGATLRAHIERAVKAHRERGTYKTNPMNVIDEFLVEMDNNKNKAGNPDDDIYTDQNLVCVINDLFMTGSETSANITAFAVRFMVQYPEVQAKIQEEIDRVIGNDRMVRFTDKPGLRYTDATVLEILRIITVAPIGPRRAYATYQFGGYEIPKGSSVIVNYYSSSMDESTWGDPYNFRPDRFLNENGDIVNAEKLIVFGSGKRNCIGEITARTSVFMALANIVQAFKIEPDPKHGVPPSTLKAGFTLCPVPYTIKVTSRH